MDKLEKKVLDFIKKENLIDSNKIVLAFSYGIDSRSLLSILNNLGYEVIVAHVNHKVRVESDNEEKETIKLCNKLNLKYYIKHLDLVNNNFEDYARKERYNFFKEVALKENTNIIVTAHHLDDNLETVLQKLINGSNLYGYSGIHSIVYNDSFKIVRPLLCVTKDELYQYEKQNGLNHFEDYTNKLNLQQRNRIRNNVIPLLKEENPSLLNKVYEYSNMINEAFIYIRKNSISYIDKWNNSIDNIEYKLLDIALRKDIICYMLEQNKINRSNNLIELIDSNILSNKSQLEIKLSNDLYFFKRYNTSYISKKNHQTSYCFNLGLNETVEILNHKFYFTNNINQSNENHIKLCYNDLKLPLVIRTRKNGDFISLSSGKKKLKDLFIDKKITKEIRDSIPIVEMGGNIIWIPGVIKSNDILQYKDNYDIYLIDEVKQNDE